MDVQHTDLQNNLRVLVELIKYCLYVTAHMIYCSLLFKYWQDTA